MGDLRLGMINAQASQKQLVCSWVVGCFYSLLTSQIANAWLNFDFFLSSWAISSSCRGVYFQDIFDQESISKS